MGMSMPPPGAYPMGMAPRQEKTSPMFCMALLGSYAEYRLRRFVARPNIRPTKPMPSGANEPGSGTAIEFPTPGLSWKE
jgi:hypothetical protein